MKKFYLTTAIPYVNGRPHIGHALEYFQADTIRKYYQIKGYETLLLSGADENALKNVQAAEKAGVPVQLFLDQNSQVFKDTYEFLGVHLDVFQRGSDKEKHWRGVQKLWQLCVKSGDIYKKAYKGLYCVGCEAFKAEEELVGGLCPEHQKKPELVEEENYFFALSKYQEQLIKLIESNEFKITPDNKRAETLAFIKRGLEDFSVSRSVERAKGVGVPVPGDPKQIIYVWFDALNIYMTGVGFGIDEKLWAKWWPADLHIIGKDINRFHTVYWPAMLLSAGIPLPKQILIHSFVNVNNQKMSKSIGNVVDPYELVEKFGLEPIRYYLLSQIPVDNDGDFSYERFTEVYNADLANGLGNLIQRIAKLAESANLTVHPTAEKPMLDTPFTIALDKFEFNVAINYIWQKIHQLDNKIEEKKPWELVKTDPEAAGAVIDNLVRQVREISELLQPILPETSKKIKQIFHGPKIVKPEQPLFPRIT